MKTSDSAVRSKGSMLKVFLSHSHKDKSFVEKLAHDLLLAEIDVWYDDWELEIGHSLTIKIQQGIESSEYLAIVLSPDAIKSAWVEKEWTTALKRELDNRQVVVLPILYKACQPPPFLDDKKYADFSDPTQYQQRMEDLIRRIRGESKKPKINPSPRSQEPRYTYAVRASFQGQTQIRKGNELEIYRWIGNERQQEGHVRIGRMKDLTDEIEYDYAFPMMTIMPVDLIFRGRVRGNIVKKGNATEFDLEMTDEEYQKYHPCREAKKNPMVR